MDVNEFIATLAPIEAINKCLLQIKMFLTFSQNSKMLLKKTFKEKWEENRVESGKNTHAFTYFSATALLAFQVIMPSMSELSGACRILLAEILVIYVLVSNSSSL